MTKYLYKDKDFLIESYVTNNKTLTEIAKELNKSPLTIKKYLKLYEIEKPQSDKNKATNNLRKKTCLEKYGAENFLHSIQGIEKKKQTCLNKYGCEYYLASPEIKKIMIDKYGVKSNLERKDVQNKIKITNLNKYGYENVSQNLNVKNKKKESYLLKYGEDNPFKVSYIKQQGLNVKIKKGTVKFIFGKLASEWVSQYSIPLTNLYNFYYKNPNITKDEFTNYISSYKKHLTDIENIISLNLKIKLFNRYPNETLKYKPDFKISNLHYLNVDGLYYHSESKVDNKYHFNMRLSYEKEGFRLFQFRANEVYNKISAISSIINGALSKDKFKEEEILVKDIDIESAKLFLNENHLKGFVNSKHLGLYINNILISVISYRKIKGNIKIDRFCSKRNHSEVLCEFLKLIKIRNQNSTIYCWIDLRYENDSYLLLNGFEKKKEILDWEWTNFKEVFDKRYCRANMDERNLSESEYASELGLVKIYDAGKRLYEK